MLKPQIMFNPFLDGLAAKAGLKLLERSGSLKADAQIFTPKH